MIEFVQKEKQHPLQTQKVGSKKLRQNTKPAFQNSYNKQPINHLTLALVEFNKTLLGGEIASVFSKFLNDNKLFVNLKIQKLMVEAFMLDPENQRTTFGREGLEIIKILNLTAINNKPITVAVANGTSGEVLCATDLPITIGKITKTRRACRCSQNVVRHGFYAII